MRILVVCTGNICRSPLAERLLTRAAGLGPHALTAESAGTQAVTGAGMDPDAATVLTDLGGDPTGFAARAFTPLLAERADLVLTMERGHRAEVLQQAPRALRRTFTLREAAAVLALVPTDELPTGDDVEERGTQLVAALARHRARWRGSTGATDIPDPYRRGLQVHRQVGGMVADALGPLLQQIAGATVRLH